MTPEQAAREQLAFAIDLASLGVRDFVVAAEYAHKRLEDARDVIRRLYEREEPCSRPHYINCPHCEAGRYLSSWMPWNPPETQST